MIFPSICEHGNNPALQPCYFCRIENKTNSLEAQIKALTDMYKDLSIRVMAQHDFKLRQIDENRKLSKRVDGLEIEINTVRALGTRAYHPKKPHKCPVCSGQSIQDIKIVKTDSGLDKLVLECHACAGKGIVRG